MSEETSPPLDPDTVRNVAALARLDLTDGEVERFARQLGQILAYADRLGQVDTRDVPPTPYVLPLSNVIREDVTTPGLTNDEALANAPDSQGGFYRVRAFFGS